MCGTEEGNMRMVNENMLQELGCGISGQTGWLSVMELLPKVYSG